jgi:peptidoglycan/xylan/chitin deacetylase (PgdA/CDA1 family)
VLASDQPGALVISLDFELHWGMRDRIGPSPQVVETLMASRAMVRRLTDVFVERNVRATWATVGMLFASSAQEVDQFGPSVRPQYQRTELDPYAEPVGASEAEDPLHLAGSLVDDLARAPGQEVASHTFSHYYCLEQGQDAEAFRSDLHAARAIAASRNIALRSLVLPRNQWRADFADVVLESGFECYRGPQPGWATQARSADDGGLVVRAARLFDTYAGRPLHTFAWSEIVEPSGLCNIPASAFFRPVSPLTSALEPLRRARLMRGLQEAARRGRILHLWWHPQNFVGHPEANMAQLERLLDDFDQLRTTHGLRSLTMSEVADVARDTAMHAPSAE